MTYSEVAALAASIGIPSAYYQFEEGTKVAPPFLCFLFPDSADFFADDSNYQKAERCVFELYTDAKDFALEKTVEDALTEAGLTYTHSETHLDSERMHMVTYDFTVVITEE